ncbi:MAG: TIGR00282 family metallophosphoesterase [Oscillospiraceae bacterium]|nr:TIGR00282 family metallophosphoesterase [Oscillospiraceae bacterium]MDY4190596.1 TIGR00282 family metallophosphoesterase [Oscillospiraceae bacterium]
MRALVIGDVVGQAGCEFLRRELPRLKREYSVDLTVVNGENSAEGNGILPHSAKAIFDCGADVITTGNHGLRRREINDLMDRGEGLLRPANYHPSAHGRGWYVYDAMAWKACVINLQGSVYLDTYENPFVCIDRILEQVDTPIILVDLHGEATSEKEAMGYYLDGRVSAVFGTHTHVQTADEQILPKGTAYLSDLGMCGPFYSVLGVSPELAIRRLSTGLPTRFENAEGPCALGGAVIEIDEKTGRAKSIFRVQVR